MTQWDPPEAEPNGAIGTSPAHFRRPRRSFKSAFSEQVDSLASNASSSSDDAEDHKLKSQAFNEKEYIAQRESDKGKFAYNNFSGETKSMFDDTDSGRDDVLKGSVSPLPSPSSSTDSSEHSMHGAAFSQAGNNSYNSNNTDSNINMSTSTDQNNLIDGESKKEDGNRDEDANEHEHENENENESVSEHEDEEEDEGSDQISYVDEEDNDPSIYIENKIHSLVTQTTNRQNLSTNTGIDLESYNSNPCNPNILTPDDYTEAIEPFEFEKEYGKKNNNLIFCPKIIFRTIFPSRTLLPSLFSD